VFVAPDGSEVGGWALNISRGGLRVILDEVVAQGALFDVVLGEQGRRQAEVVWVREEAGGAIVGVSFLDADAPESTSAQPASAERHSRASSPNLG